MFDFSCSLVFFFSLFYRLVYTTHRLNVNSFYSIIKSYYSIIHTPTLVEVVSFLLGLYTLHTTETHFQWAYSYMVPCFSGSIHLLIQALWNMLPQLLGWRCQCMDVSRCTVITYFRCLASA